MTDVKVLCHMAVNMHALKAVDDRRHGLVCHTAVNMHALKAVDDRRYGLVSHGCEHACTEGCG